MKIIFSSLLLRKFYGCVCLLFSDGRLVCATSVMSTYNPGTYILTQTSRQRQFFYEILNTILKLIFPLHKVAKYFESASVKNTVKLTLK